MKKENIYKQLRENTETITRPALTQGELAAIFEKEGNPLSQSVISKVETSTKEPPTTSSDVLRAYAIHFNVTADFLLGIRPNSFVDEDLAMIGRVTGLSDKSIKMLKQYKNLYLDILNYLIESNALFELTKTIVIDAPHDFLGNNKEDYLSHGEYVVIRKIEEIMKQLFRNKTLHDKISKYNIERIKAKYGNDPNEILKMPELPED